MATTNYIPASYYSESVFRVNGDKTPYYMPGQRVKCFQGSAGNNEGTIQSSEYVEGSVTGEGVTNVTVTLDSGAILRPSLFRVSLGDTYSDDENPSGNIGEHDHKNPWSGGAIPAATISEAQTDNLKTIDVPASGDAGKLLAVAPTFSDGYQLKTIQGTTNRVTVTIADGLITLTLPQDFHTGASIQLAQLLLSSLLVGTERTTPEDNASAGTRRLYPKTTGWVDQDDEGVETAFSMDGHTHAHSAITGKDTDGHPASIIAPVTTAFGGILSSEEDTVQKALDKLDDITLDSLGDVSTSGVQAEDILVYRGGSWIRLAKGNEGDVLAIVGGEVAWASLEESTTTTTTT